MRVAVVMGFALVSVESLPDWTVCGEGGGGDGV